MNKLGIFLSILLISVLIVPAAAQDLYNNGPTDGQTLGWTINFGFGVSDQFTFGADTTMNGIQFAAWLFPGDVLQTVDVSITSSEFGGTSFFDGTVRFTAGTCFSNGGFNVCNESGSITPTALAAGSYWLNLDNGVVANGDPVYWDQNSGPSLASQSSLGTIPSESFSLDGACSAGKSSPNCGPPPPTSPEPGSFLLFGSGVMTLLGFLGTLRHK